MKSKLFHIAMVAALLSSLAAALPAGAYVPQSSADVAEAQATAAQGNQDVIYMPREDDASLPAQVPAKRWILQLEDPPLAQYQGGVNSLRATAASVTGAARLDVNTAAAVAYTSYLESKQAELAAAVAQAVPGAYVERDYQVVFNGVTVNLPEADERAGEWLSKLPGVVRVFREQAYQLDMYASLPLINAPALWAQLGGVAEAGKGVKVAVIDTGIYITNTCFNPAGYTYPAGFPKMDTDKPAATSAKVIAARAYFRDGDPPPAGDGATWPGPASSSHGTHVAGTIACAPGIVADVAGYTEVITGVAPAAYLMSYRVFYPTASDAWWSGSAFDPELIDAIEDAVVDGADVVNNSWGGGAPSAYPRALDLAYDAAWDAGMVVIFAAGNSGPYKATIDHPSSKLIRVGASTTSGTIASGRLSVSESVSPTLQDMAYTLADFGQALPAGNIYTYPMTAAQVISPANFNGCNPWPAGTFAGIGALISRGTCEFSQKVHYAQQAGATFVIIHNHAAGGDALITMGAGAFADQVTIPSIFIGNTSGLAMVDWIQAHADAQIVFNTIGYQAGSIPDRLTSFSSRGPFVGRAMGPDVVAPGDNILSSGYGAAAGEAKHMGFGQSSGTSMAAPHVSGSAALLKQLHPTWTPAQVKSALMGTANLNVANHDGGVASVLDYGAGRIDLGQAYDPGLTFDQPSLSFAPLRAAQSASLVVAATDVFSHTAAVDYTLSVSETGNVTTTDYFTLSVAPAGLSFDQMGDTGAFTVTMQIAAGAPAGDYTGFVWLRDGSHELHIPVWVQVLPAAAANPVLLIDGELSPYTGGDYTSYYTSTLDALGIGYDYYDPMSDPAWALPDLATLQQYQTIIWYTGDNFYVDVPGEAGQDLLIAYLQGGGRLLATGQDLSSVADSLEPDDAPTPLYNFFMGAGYVQDNVFSGTQTISRPVTGLSWAQNIRLDLGYPSAGDGAQNQGWVDEIRVYGTAEPDELSFPPVPFLQAATGDHKADGFVGLSHAAEPTLEKPQQLAPWRTIYLSFGFEGINNPIPGTLQHVSSRQELMGRMLAYLGVEPTASLANVTATVDEELTLTATGGFARPEMAAVSSITQYRWDFGDGSDYAVTTVPTATHTYTQTGTFTPRVEVTEIYGHKAIASGTATVTPLVSYTLQLATAGNGHGTVTPAVGTYTYLSGTTVIVTATAATDSDFAGWSGAATGLTNPVSILMDGNKVLTATFTLTSFKIYLPVVMKGF